MKSKKTKKLYAYACATDFFYEMHADVTPFPELYNTVKELKSCRSCWLECGIVKIELKLNKWIHKQNFREAIKEK